MPLGLRPKCLALDSSYKRIYAEFYGTHRIALLPAVINIVYGLHTGAIIMSTIAITGTKINVQFLTFSVPNPNTDFGVNNMFEDVGIRYRAIHHRLFCKTIQTTDYGLFS